MFNILSFCFAALAVRAAFFSFWKDTEIDAPAGNAIDKTHTETRREKLYMYKKEEEPRCVQRPEVLHVANRNSSPGELLTVSSPAGGGV